MCFIFSTFFAIFTTAIPFIYRYFLLCRETKLKTHHIILLFVISAVLALGFDLLCGLSFLSQQESHDRYSALLDVEIWGDGHKTIPNFIAVDIC
uniref:Integral membrane protein n=1 Tax=Acrobeloides nanus TaxID=290746 RepID=A0A914BZL9_9BILA